LLARYGHESKWHHVSLRSGSGPHRPGTHHCTPFHKLCK
jgi:hypothetical protein